MHSPPLDLSAPSTASVTFSVICAVILVAAFAWATFRALGGDPLGIYMLLGGLVACLIEPMLDNLGLLWFAADNELIVFDAFGRHIALYVVAGYGFFFGAEAYVGYYALIKGKGAAWLWRLYAFGWFFDLALESTGHWMGLYKYYGPQPFNAYGIPLWWMFINPALPIVAGGLFYAMREQLKGARGLLVIPLLPMCYGAVYAATSWPIFTALNSNVSDLVIWVAGAVTIFQALLLVHLTIKGLDRLREFERREGTLPEPDPGGARTRAPVPQAVA
jgi:hypothetical protein